MCVCVLARLVYDPVVGSVAVGGVVGEVVGCSATLMFRVTEVVVVTSLVVVTNVIHYIPIHTLYTYRVCTKYI